MSGKEVDIGHVYRSLKKSTVRDKVFSYVCTASEEVSIKEIANAIHCPEKNVTGALFGDGKRYNQEDALLGLGVLECRECVIHGYSMILVTATEKGKDIFEKGVLKDYAYTSEGSADDKQEDDDEGM